VRLYENEVKGRNVIQPKISYNDFSNDYKKGGMSFGDRSTIESRESTSKSTIGITKRVRFNNDNY